MIKLERTFREMKRVFGNMPTSEHQKGTMEICFKLADISAFRPDSLYHFVEDTYVVAKRTTMTGWKTCVMLLELSMANATDPMEELYKYEYTVNPLER